MDGNTVIEGSVKHRYGKKWKTRWAVVSKLSPVADCVELQLYKDVKDRHCKGQTKATFSLHNFLGTESGFFLGRECYTMAIICKETVIILAFFSREHLLQWKVKLEHSVGEDQQYIVQIASVPAKSKITQGPARLHLLNRKFCLISGIPPKILQEWNISDIRRYGVVGNKFCFEAGVMCGRGEGVYVFLTNQASELEQCFHLATEGKLNTSRMKGKLPLLNCVFSLRASEPENSFGNRIDRFSKGSVMSLNDQGLGFLNKLHLGSIGRSIREHLHPTSVYPTKNLQVVGKSPDISSPNKDKIEEEAETEADNADSVCSGDKSSSDPPITNFHPYWIMNGTLKEEKKYTNEKMLNLANQLCSEGLYDRPNPIIKSIHSNCPNCTYCSPILPRRRIGPVSCDFCTGSRASYLNDDVKRCQSATSSPVLTNKFTLSKVDPTQPQKPQCTSSPSNSFCRESLSSPLEPYKWPERAHESRNETLSRWRSTLQKINLSRPEITSGPIMTGDNHGYGENDHFKYDPINRNSRTTSPLACPTSPGEQFLTEESKTIPIYTEVMQKGDDLITQDRFTLTYQSNPQIYHLESGVNDCGYDSSLCNYVNIDYVESDLDKTLYVSREDIQHMGAVSDPEAMIIRVGQETEPYRCGGTMMQCDSGSQSAHYVEMSPYTTSRPNTTPHRQNSIQSNEDEFRFPTPPDITPVLEDTKRCSLLSSNINRSLSRRRSSSAENLHVWDKLLDSKENTISRKFRGDFVVPRIMREKSGSLTNLIEEKSSIEEFCKEATHSILKFITPTVSSSVSPKQFDTTLRIESHCVNQEDLYRVSTNVSPRSHRDSSGSQDSGISTTNAICLKYEAYDGNDGIVNDAAVRSSERKMSGVPDIIINAPCGFENPLSETKSVSSGTSDLTDCSDSLSISSHSSLDVSLNRPTKLFCGSKFTVLKPRSGNEYQTKEALKLSSRSTDTECGCPNMDPCESPELVCVAGQS